MRKSHPLVSRFRPCMKAVRRRAALARVNRTLDWALMRVFGYDGDHSLYGVQKGKTVAFGPPKPGSFQPSNVTRAVDSEAFLLWAVTAGPMVFSHVLRTCRKAGYGLNLNCPVYEYRENCLPGWVFPVEHLLRACRIRRSPADWFASPSEEDAFAVFGMMAGHGVRFPLGEPEQGRPMATPAIGSVLVALPNRFWSMAESVGFVWLKSANHVVLVRQAAREWPHVQSGAQAFERVCHLLEKGIPAGGNDYFGHAVLHGLCESDYVFSRPLFDVLIKAGADIHAVARKSAIWSPHGMNCWHFLLHWSVFKEGWCAKDKHRLLSKMAYLKRKSVDPNQPDGHGFPPLHCALQTKRVHGATCPDWLMEAFIRCGGDLGIVSPGGTVMDIARAHGHASVVDSLIRIGALQEKETITRHLAKVAKGGNASGMPLHPLRRL